LRGRVAFAGDAGAFRDLDGSPTWRRFHSESANDADAEAKVYAAAFQAWVDHKIHGTPNEIFDAIQSALEI